MALAVGMPAQQARAELTCEQIGAISSQTIEARDRGVSLSSMMSELERREMREKFTPEELTTMRQTIRVIFMSEAWPKEVLEACRENEKKREKERARGK